MPLKVQGIHCSIAPLKGDIEQSTHTTLLSNNGNRVIYIHPIPYQNLTHFEMMRSNRPLLIPDLYIILKNTEKDRLYIGKSISQDISFHLFDGLEPSKRILACFITSKTPSSKTGNCVSKHDYIWLIDI